MDLGPSGLSQDYWNRPFNDRPRTDQNGDYLWVHAPMTNGLAAYVGGNSREAEVLLAQLQSKDTQELTVTLGAGDLQKVFPTRVLEGKLLLPDGASAKDWFVSQAVDRSTGEGVSNGPMTDSYITKSFIHPAADGGFTLRAPGRFLGLISPEGFEFLYTLHPETWGGGIHRVNPTVPAASRTIKLQLVDETGKPVANVPVRPTCMQSGQYEWELNVSTAWGMGMAGNAPWKMMTDGAGWLTMPVYAGARTRSYQIGNTFQNGLFLDSDYTGAILGNYARETVRRPSTDGRQKQSRRPLPSSTSRSISSIRREKPSKMCASRSSRRSDRVRNMVRHPTPMPTAITIFCRPPPNEYKSRPETTSTSQSIRKISPSTAPPANASK